MIKILLVNGIHDTTHFTVVKFKILSDGQVLQVSWRTVESLQRLQQLHSNFYFTSSTSVGYDDNIIQEDNIMKFILGRTNWIPQKVIYSSDSNEVDLEDIRNSCPEYFLI